MRSPEDASNRRVLTVCLSQISKVTASVQRLLDDCNQQVLDS